MKRKAWGQDLGCKKAGPMPRRAGFLSSYLYPAEPLNQSLLATFFLFLAVLVRILSNPLGNVYQKQLTARGHHPLLVNFLTYLLLSIACIVPAFFVRWPVLPSAFWWYALLAGVAGACGNGFLVKALEKGDLSVLGPINAYKSVAGLVTGIFLLREIPNAWGLLGIALIVAGSYFVLDTTAEGFSWALLKRSEIQYRIWALLLTAVEAVFLKKIILLSSATLAFFSWCWLGAVFSFLLLRVYRLPLRQEVRQVKRADTGRYGLLTGSIGMMQLSTHYVFDRMPVGYALALFQLSILVSVLLGQRFFGEGGIRKKLVGSAIMLAGSVLIVLLKG